MDARFRWGERLHYTSEFRRVFKEGRRFSASGLTVWILKRAEGEPPLHARLGLAISKTYGHAVARNRMKRLLREAFRLNKTDLPPGVDMVFSCQVDIGESSLTDD